MNENVSHKITMYNFWMTLSIVAYHFVFDVKVTKHWTRVILIGGNRILNGLGILAMCTFFLFSGFLLFNNANSSKDILKKMRSRVFSLLIPFILWNFVTFLFLYDFKSIKDFVWGFITIPYNKPTWYLLSLSVLMLFAPLIIKLKHRKKLTIAIFSTIIVIAYCLNYYRENINWYNNLLDNVWYIGNTLSYIPLYLIGAFAGMHYSDKILYEKYNVNRVKIIAMAIFIPSFVSLCLKDVYSFTILASISFWFCFEAKLFKNKPSQAFNVSFLIYVMHIPFLINIACNILFLFVNPNSALPIVKFLGKIIGTVMVWLCAVVFDWAFKLMFGSRVYGVFVGNRTNRNKG